MYVSSIDERAPLCTLVAERTDVFLASAELATVAAVYGRLPTPAEYLDEWKKIDAAAADTYRYLNFDTLQSFADKAHSVHLSQEMIAAARKLQTSP